MAESIEKIKRIKAQHEKYWLGIEGVVAVDVGGTSDGGLGLIISVKKDATGIQKHIPRRIENVLIEIRETGEVRRL